MKQMKHTNESLKESSKGLLYDLYVPLKHQKREGCLPQFGDSEGDV